MNSNKNTPRLLGVAFLVVLFLTFSELWIMSIIGTGSIEFFVPNKGAVLTFYCAIYRLPWQ